MRAAIRHFDTPDGTAPAPRPAWAAPSRPGHPHSGDPPMRAPTTPAVLLPLAVVTLGMLAGCADAPTAASRAAELRVSRAASAAVERPWKGRCDVETVATEIGSTGPTKFHQAG